MRVMILALVALLGACAAGGGGAAEEAASGPSPFPVQRGTVERPPAAAGQTAPPEGAGRGGVDFGQWRRADPAVYAPAFQTQIRQRFAN
ncbi:MAG: hypothetical protein IT547_13050, partial [Hyphomonadaceae bacterium]|nr:hypothetical protein [Hyphomonadaceae bacterium]